MKTAVIIGTIVATRKDDRLVGKKLLLTQPVDINKKPIGEPFVCIDTVGAGIGEFVMYATGTAARNAANNREAPIDAAIVGIIDNVDVYADVLDREKDGE